jgi:hypothetical protein
MSTVKKQVGDLVMITAGENKNKTGKLIVKNRGGWTVELEDGQQVSTSFAMVALIPETEEQTEVETQPVQEANLTVHEPDPAEDTASHSESELPVEEGNISELESGANLTEESSEQNSIQQTGNQDITKMTVKQLQALAKQRGIGIARTKLDFLRIIKEKNPDDDLDQLVGKTLFNQVSELHISRLRTKADLVKLLQS